MIRAQTILADPRHYQIAVLSALLGLGVWRLGFDIEPARVLLLLSSVLAAQWAFSRGSGTAYEPRSALISGLSLCLLLRTNDEALGVLAAVIAVSTKHLLRFRGKHLFNPTNIALVALLWTGQVWVSPGQWGNAAFLAFLFACLGGLVVTRARRADVSLGFAASYGGLLLARALWLGQPVAVPLHQLTNGAFLLFSFFMISDPKTTPDSRAGRFLFALLVALGAAFVQFVLYRPNGAILSLAFASLLVPLLDLLLPGARYSWPGVPTPRIAPVLTPRAA